MSIRRRWLAAVLLGLVGIALAIVAGAAVHFSRQLHLSHDELQAAIAELDRRDPDWRLDEIVRNRRDVPDDANGALVLQAAYRLMPADWDPNRFDRLDDLPPHLRLTPELATRLRSELAANSAALDKSRKMRDHPAGRFALEFAPDFLSNRFDGPKTARAVATLLLIDAYVSADDPTTGRAIDSTRALVNVARCFDDDPLLQSQVVRLALRIRAVRCLERTLGQETVAEVELTRMQAALTEEAADPALAIGLRGERARMHSALMLIADSDRPVAVAIQPLRDGTPAAASWWDRVMDARMRTMVRRSTAWLLEYESRVAAAAELPGKDRYDALRDLDGESRRQRGHDFVLAGLLAPALSQMADEEQRADTLLACAIAATAAERFRLKQDRWPTDLDELVRTDFLPDVPEDLYNGKPLSLRRTADGIVIHSAGPRGLYEGSRLDQVDRLVPIRGRIEVRLWDPASRRQEPAAEKKKDER